MKKIIMLIFLFAFLFASTNAYSTTLRKMYITDSDASGAWDYRWKDEWGGYNYQCAPSSFHVCPLWSWLAIYYLGINQHDDPCPQNNTAEYGETLSRNEAAQNGQHVPDSTVFTFSIEEIIE